MEKKLQDYIHHYLGCEGIDQTTGIKWHLCGCNEFGSAGWSAAGTPSHKSGEIKLLLRPLSDMTEDEMKELFFIGWPAVVQFSPVVKFYAKEVKRIIKHGDGIGYSLFTESGEHFGSGTLCFNIFNSDQFHYLLSKGFDLFGLIEANLAINANKL